MTRSNSKNQIGKKRTDLSIDGFEFPEEREPSSDAPVQLNWAEVNLLALPFAVLDEREAKTSLGHEIIKFDKQNGKQIAWLWRVWPDSKIGMPTMATMRVLIALMDKAEEVRKLHGTYPSRLDFSLGEICRRVGWPSDGRHRSMLKHHIEILVSTRCKSKGAFKDKNRNGLVIDAFSYLRRAAFVGEADDNGNPLETNYVVFDDPVRLNLESRYIKQLDVALMRSIKSSIGQLLYTKLSHLFFEAKRNNQSYVKVDYHWLAERMGIKSYQHVWEAKKQLKQAISELVELCYIYPPAWTDWSITFEPNVRYEFGESAPSLNRKKAARKTMPKQIQVSALTDQAQEETDSLLPLCNLYANVGWKWAQPQAQRRGMDEAQLRVECFNRGLL